MRRTKSQEEVDDADGADDGPGDDEGEGPVPLHEEAGDEGAQNVSDGGVGVPDPEDESLLAAAEPVCHHRHDAGPARGLKDAAGDLHAG